MCNLFTFKYFAFISIIILSCYGGNVEDEIKSTQGFMYIRVNQYSVAFGATLISNHIMLTAANITAMNDYIVKYVKMFNDENKKEITPIMKVSHYNYVPDTINNFGLLIFKENMAEITNVKPASLLNPDENIKPQSLAYITGLLRYQQNDKIQVNLEIHTMKSTKCEDYYRHLLCYVLNDDGEYLCNIIKTSAMFIEVNRGGESIYALAGLVPYHPGFCEPKSPVHVIPVNKPEVFDWIQSFQNVGTSN